MLPTDVVVNAIAFFGLYMSTIMQNFPGSFFGMTALLLAITPEPSELGNGPAIYPLLTCARKYWSTTSACSQADGVLAVDGLH